MSLFSTDFVIAIRRRGAVHSAQWYGKVCTVILETVMAVLILFPQIPGPSSL